MDLGLNVYGAVDHQQIYGTGAEDLRDWLSGCRWEKA